ncbi:malic enzyme [Musa troglodytarum]|uniref:Malic enzyme n=1 Tax=Musa troglodytarum TaxID=320322 RepID=A0A9E7KJR7_9LILI|nr:malic enzyme [Musa troglodytarum]
MVCSIRDITKEVAAAVVREAVAEDLAEGYRDMDPQELKKLTPSDPCTWSYLHILLQCLLEPNTFFVLEFYRSIGNLKDVLSSICSYMDNELIIIF